MRRLCLFLATLYCVSSSSAQSLAEQGLPFMECTGFREIGATPQNWQIAQDERDIIYVGHSGGLIEYDGGSWKVHDVTRGNNVRTVAVAGDGRVYVGTSADFGYVAPDSTGNRSFVSLLRYVDEKDRGFLDVWTIHPTPQGIFFLAREKLFRARETAEGWEIRSWTPESMFYYGFWFNDSYFVQQSGRGLTRLEVDDLVSLPGGDQFGSERAQVMLPYGTDPSHFLFGTFNRGLFLFDGKSFSPFRTEADELLRRSTLYKGTVLSDGSYAFTTLDGGIVVLAPSGKVIRYLNQDTGLPSNNVLAIFVDRSGLVWFTPHGFVCRMEVPSPLTRFAEESGIASEVMDIVRYQGMLYVTTQSGVIYFDSAGGRFRPIAGFLDGIPQSWSFMKFDDQLFVTHGTGIYRIKGTRAEAIAPGSSSFVLHRSLLDPNRIYFGHPAGVSSIRRDENGIWQQEGPVEGVLSQVNSIAEPQPGEMWLGTATSGILRLRFDGRSHLRPSVEQFGEREGLTPGRAGFFNVGGRPIFMDRKRVLKFDEANRVFIPDSSFAPLTVEPRDFPYIVEDHEGRIWASLGRGGAVFTRGEDGRLHADETPFRRFADYGVGVIYPEEDGITWFGSDREIIRYDPKVRVAGTPDFPVLVRRVAAAGDRLVYRGEGAVSSTPSIPFDENNLRFEYAAASYASPASNEYQSILEGFDEGWSDWSRETRRDYTNLPPGNYTFRVRGRNMYKQLGREAAFAMAILPPWYRTIWAYAFYVLVLGGLVFATDRFQRRRLVKRERDRAAFENAELRAAAAEAESKALQAENERNQNIELLSRIGRDITGTLAIEQIIETVYEHVNALMDAEVFGIGIYNEAEHRLEFPATKEKGVSLPLYVNSLADDSRFAVWCFKNGKEVVIQDLTSDYGRYIPSLQAPLQGEDPASILYLPLIHRDKPIGVITAQSFEKNAYTEHDLNILRNLATYTAIALDNAEAYTRLNAIVVELNQALENLKTTQEQLLTQEKMASLGALTAGIAHEIKNPLNFVNNFAQLIVELTEELRSELDASREKSVGAVLDDLDEIVMSLKTNARQIAKHGKRADDIVRGMMQHASGGAGERYEVGLNAFVEEYVQLAYHGMRARVSDFAVEVEREYDPLAGNVSMMPQDMGRVLINLLNNAFDAMRMSGNGASAPKVTIRTRRENGRAEIQVVDNGPGIPIGVRERIFEPFYTTKPTGSGTGLGLSMSYDIVVKGHGGMLSVDTEEGRGAAFTVSLPA